MSEPIAENVPSSIRRLDNEEAAALVDYVSAYDDLQAVLGCCERLVTILDSGAEHLDQIGMEALWTSALVCYARCFGPREPAPVLTEADLTASDGTPTDPASATASATATAEKAPSGADDALQWHRVLLHLRDHHTDLSTNPRETFSVGVAQGDDGIANAVAVTSVHAPRLDAAAVRRMGAMAYQLCVVLDDRIATAQKRVLDKARESSSAQLEELELIEVAAAP